MRAAKDWNSLPEETTSSCSLNIFKIILDRQWAELHTIIWDVECYDGAGPIGNACRTENVS